MPRTLAIGDVHGCDRALAALLELIAPTADDTVVILGDVVDRGPASKQCVDRLIALRDQCRLVAIMGNHDEMMLHALHGGGSLAWQKFGGLETLESYGGHPDDVPRRHVEFLEAMVDFHETPTELFVHANWNVGVPRRNQQPEFLRWRHLTGGEQPLPSGQRIVCGHTSQKNGQPFVLPGWVCIDTYVWGGGWLTCLDCETDHVFRANEAGRTEGPRPLADVAQSTRDRS